MYFIVSVPSFLYMCHDIPRQAVHLCACRVLSSVWAGPENVPWVLSLVPPGNMTVEEVSVAALWLSKAEHEANVSGPVYLRFCH